MKRFRRAASFVLSVSMILTGCLFSLPVASAAESQEGPVLVDYSVEVTNTSPKTEEGEEFIVSLKFDKELTTDRYTSSAFNVSVNGKTPADMGFQNPAVSVSENDSKTLILDFKGVEGSTWTYLVSRSLTISLKSNYYEDIMNKDGVGVPEDGWTDIYTYIPAIAGATGTNDVFEKVSYTQGSKAQNVKESVTFRIIGDAKARAANAIQILNGNNIDTDNTIIPNSANAAVTVHTHMFKTMTNADIAKSLASSFNNVDSNYEMTANPDTDVPTNSTVTITAKEASDTQGLDKASINLIAYSTPNDRIVQQTYLKSELASAEQRLQSIDDTKVAPAEKAALAAAIQTASAAYAKVGDDTTAIEFNKIRNALRSAVNAAADNAISTDSATRDGVVTLSLAGGTEWTDQITAVLIDGQAVDSDDYSIKSGKLSISSLAFADPQRTKTYNVTVQANGYSDVTKDVTVKFYGAQTFQLRYVDGNGNVIKSKSYTKDELKEMSDNQDYYYHAICTMRGLTAFKGQGVTLVDLLKDAGIEFSEGMSAQLRTNDSVETSETNDPTDENAYYSRGNFDYNYLMQDRYYFPDLYNSDTDLAKAAVSAGGRVTFKAGDAIRTAAGASDNKVLTTPLIAFEFAERSWSVSNPDSLENTGYDEAESTDNCFRFLFGTALDTEDGTTVSKAETTLWSLSYQTFGIDIIDTSSHYAQIDPETASYGTVDLSAAGGRAGDEITFTTKAKNGYRDMVYVTTADGTIVDVEKNGDTYSFTMPDEDVTIHPFEADDSDVPSANIQYSVKITNASSNMGTVTSDVSRAKQGEKVTIHADAKEGYEVTGISVSGGAEVSGPDASGNYTFIMPAADVTVTAEYKDLNAPDEPDTPDTPDEPDQPTVEFPFQDVPADRWSRSAVEYVFSQNLFKGTSDTLFSPEQNMSRAMMVTVLYRLEGSPQVSGSTSFNDLVSGEYYVDAVTWAAANGIVLGIDENTFDPNAEITREQLTAIMYRYANYKQYDLTASGSLDQYTDKASVSSYAEAPFTWAVSNQLVNGMTDSELVPQGTATREQVAAVIMRFAEKYVK